VAALSTIGLFRREESADLFMEELRRYYDGELVKAFKERQQAWVVAIPNESLTVVAEFVPILLSFFILEYEALHSELENIMNVSTWDYTMKRDRPDKQTANVD
jgi:hypothetical protein